MAKNPTPEELDLREAEQEERQIHRAIGGMIDESDTEVFRYGSAKNDDEVEPDPEDDGDHSLEEPDEDIAGGEPEQEQQAPSEDEAEDGEPEAEPEQEEPGAQQPQRDERSERFVPSYRLREEAEARQRAERELADMRARQQQYQPPPPPQFQPQPQKPDLFVDPDAHTAWVQQQTLLAARAQNMEMSLASAAEEHGDDYQYVYRTLASAVQRNDPAAQQVVAAVLSSANPGRALMRWGEPLLQERQDREENTHREWLRDRYGIDAEQLEQRGSGQRAPRQATPPRRGMPSLNSAAGNGRLMSRPRDNMGGLSNSDEDIFNDVFDKIER
jgi:hypothetical protein